MFDLRYYQHEARAAAAEKWLTNQSTAIICVTGGGKTEMFLSDAVEEPGRVLVIVHRDYLISSPIARLEKVGFEDVGIEKADQKSETGGMYSRAKIVFASIQSISKPDRLATFNPNDFSKVIVDEGHRAVATTYRRVLDHFRTNPKLKILILTATPKRKDGVALGNVCESVAYVYPPAQAMSDGWIVPVRFYRREVQSLDFSNVRMKGGDLDPDQVESLMNSEGPLHEVCSTLAEDTGPGIVFCPTVAVAQAYNAIMNKRYRPNRSAVLWADSDDETRATVGKQLANGDIDNIFNVDLFTEGFDVPNLHRVIWAAPTASLVRYTQGCGRVFRTHDDLRGLLTGDRAESAARRLMIQQSRKPFGKIVTYYPQNCKHQLCDPIDILGGEDLAAEVKAYARQLQDKTAAQSGGSDTEDDIGSATDVVDLRSALSSKLKELKAKARYSDSEYDAMGGSSNRASATNPQKVRKSADEVTASWGGGDPLTDKQASWFRWKGIRNLGQFGGFTKFRAVVVRDLMEKGITFETAAAWPKNQALKVRDSKKEAA